MMKKVILFTNKPSLKKHWENALFNHYNRVPIEDLAELQSYLITNAEAAILMIDELSVQNIDKLINDLQENPKITVLLFNSIPVVQHASRLIITYNHIRGYENSYLDKVNLLNMLTTVQNNKRWLFSDLTNYIINKYIDDVSNKEPDFMPLLTPKEKEIALMIADGYTNKEIVAKEKIALSTIKNHINKIFEKAGVSDRVSLALKFK